MLLMVKYSNGLIYTAPYLDATTNKMIITIAKPLRKDGAIIGVAAADIYVDVLTGVVEKASMGEGSYAFLLDADRNFIVHKNKEFLPTEDSLKNISEEKYNGYRRQDQGCLSADDRY